MRELPYRNMQVWQKGYALAMQVLETTDAPQFRREWDLRRQVNRAAMSVPANLAEGYGRGTASDFATFVDTARGSLFEVDNWLLACRDRSLIEAHHHEALHEAILELNAMLRALLDNLRQRTGEDRRRRS